jgi:hypothetical protein
MTYNWVTVVDLQTLVFSIWIWLKFFQWVFKWIKATELVISAVNHFWAIEWVWVNVLGTVAV